jgi:2-polyprenyl-6-hydroxyphenyl methylase/3-demethylubiquinone-9 3-methyltransferase
MTRRAWRAGMDLGFLPYRPFGPTEAAVWDATYAGGAWDYMSELAEAPRYAVLIGYIRHVHQRPSVLDVGCGLGLLRARIGDLPMERFVGIDPSARAIEEAKSLEDELTQFKVAAVPSSELGTFDVVVCNEMLYYLTRPGDLFDAIHAALNPNGHLLCSIWKHPGVSALQRVLDKRFPLRAAAEVRSLTGPRKAWRVSCHRHPDATD